MHHIHGQRWSTRCDALRCEKTPSSAHFGAPMTNLPRRALANARSGRPAKAEPFGPSAMVLADESRVSGRLGAFDEGEMKPASLCRICGLGSLGSLGNHAHRGPQQSDLACDDGIAAKPGTRRRPITLSFVILVIQNGFITPSPGTGSCRISRSATRHRQRCQRRANHNTGEVAPPSGGRGHKREAEVDSSKKMTGGDASWLSWLGLLASLFQPTEKKREKTKEAGKGNKVAR